MRLGRDGPDLVRSWTDDPSQIDSALLANFRDGKLQNESAGVGLQIDDSMLDGVSRQILSPVEQALGGMGQTFDDLQDTLGSINTRELQALAAQDPFQEGKSLGSMLAYAQPDNTTFGSAVRDTVRAVVNTGINFAEGVPNLLGNLTLPGLPDYNPFLSDYRRPYETPAYGALLEFLGGAAVLGGMSARAAVSRRIPGASLATAESEASVVFNNGWRTADGKFASPLGNGRAGATAETVVWDAIDAKSGWGVVRGQVAVRDASGQLRYYDGAAISPRGRVIGLETKSGSAVRTSEQRLFDSTLNSNFSNVARGVGQSKGITVQRSILIRVP